MRAAGLEAAAAEQRLAILGGFHPDPAEGLGATLVLLGPAEPGYWAHVTAQSEFDDGAPDPIDRWSERVIGGMARDFGAKAFFPFGPPPYQPFYTWAVRTGRAWPSPVTLLVHDTAGLLVSYRGALALPERIDLPAPAARPCDSCSRPCLKACPVGALGAQGYDLSACHGFLDTPPGGTCMSFGCQVRTSCPVSHSYARLPEQSAYHMRQFHR